MNIKDEHIDSVCSLLDQLVGNVSFKNLLLVTVCFTRKRQCLLFGKIKTLFTR